MACLPLRSSLSGRDPGRITRTLSKAGDAEEACLVGWQQRPAQWEFTNCSSPKPTEEANLNTYTGRHLHLRILYRGILPRAVGGTAEDDQTLDSKAPLIRMSKDNKLQGSVIQKNITINCENFILINFKISLEIRKSKKFQWCVQKGANRASRNKKHGWRQQEVCVAVRPAGEMDERVLQDASAERLRDHQRDPFYCMYLLSRSCVCACLCM